MISKFLFTLSVIVVVILFFKIRNSQSQNSGASTIKKIPSENEKMFRQGAYLFMLFMVLSALVVFFFKLGDDYETVNVHVINTQTGQKQSYLAEQRDIRPKSFKTVNGKTVYVADIERIEIEPVE